MKTKYYLQLLIRVSDPKYREFTNYITKELSKEKKNYCSNKIVLQSINNITKFEYREEWKSIEKLKEHIESSDFKSLNGIVSILSEDLEIKIIEFKENNEINKLLF